MSMKNSNDSVCIKQLKCVHEIQANKHNHIDRHLLCSKFKQCVILEFT
jgi:hypothetical protein